MYLPFSHQDWLFLMNHNFTILCDFDGTIVESDVAEFILDLFVKEEWKIYDQMFEKGEITLEECMKSQYSKIKATKEEILKRISGVFQIRSHFGDLIEFAFEYKIPFIIVSAGLDLTIRKILSDQGYANLEVVAAKAKPDRGGMKLEFPSIEDPIASDFKEGMVLKFKKGNRVFYIGDGSSDLTAARKADVVFCVKDSRLAELCKEEKIVFIEFKDFRHVKNYIVTVFEHSSIV